MVKHLFSFLVILASVASLRAHAAVVFPRYSILQGSTSARESHFTLVAKASEALSIRSQAPSGEYLSPTSMDRVTEPGSDWVVYRFHFSNLDPRLDYKLQVYDRDGQLSDQRVFSSLDINAESGRVALGSCMVRQLHNPWMWQTIESARPDLILILGDAVYLDRDETLSSKPPRSRRQVWNSFVQSRNTLALYFWERLRPVLSVWDDHDSGFDNDTALFPLMADVREIYETFFANESLPGFMSQGPGLAKTFSLFGKTFIMLDGRSFRELDSSSPFLGQAQEAWLHQQLQPGQNVILNGSQFYGRYIQKDSLEFNWPEYALRFTQSLRQAADAVQARLVFASGDIHFSEVQRLEPELFGYETYEITSSSIHSFAFPGHYVLKPDNPRRMAVTGTHNAVFLDFVRGQNDFEVTSLGWRGTELFRMRLDLQAFDSAPTCAQRLTGNAK